MMSEEDDTMITQVRSWTHDDSVPRLIGRKRVDWSIFEYGTTIPNDFRRFFIDANGGKLIEAGDGQQLILIYKDKPYQASIRNVDQKSVDRETLQLRYHSAEIKELMASVFRASYEYIAERKPQDAGNRKQVVVPEGRAEYIEFYATGTPFIYEMKLIPALVKSMQQPSVWWVNQGTTFAEERAEGIMWAPLTGKGGRSQYHWDTMDEVKQGDIVLNYANGFLQHVSRVLEGCTHAKKPGSMLNSPWEEEGRLVRLEYHSLQPKIPLVDFAQDVLKLQINQGPIHSGAGVKQGYLFRFSVQALQVVQEKFPAVSWPGFTILKKAENMSEAEVERVLDTVEDLEVRGLVNRIEDYIKQQGFHFPTNLIENFYLSIKTKPFVILAGVSGTGKTKLVKLFAEALGATSGNQQFTLIPVRPDWSDPSDLLGYKDLSGVFRPGRLTEVLLEASKPSNRHKPYFICLDEMNLARVEHYFSDVLSVIETQEWCEGQIVTTPLIQADSLQGDDQSKYGNLHLPDNVYLIGTVNMDETTHPFSKKVLDRANTIEFNYINLMQFTELEEIGRKVATVAISNDFLRSEYLQLVDLYSEETELVKRTTEKLVKVNGILEQIHSHVGFRIRDAVCFYLAYNKRFELLTEEEAFDLQLLQKILPRVQGSSSSIERVLLRLMDFVFGRSVKSDDDSDDTSGRYEKWTRSSFAESAVYPHSARKIAFMLRRLEEDGFTSYWIS